MTPRYDVRPISEADWDAFVDVVENAFGNNEPPEVLEIDRSVHEIDRSIAAYDGALLVGTAGAYSLRMTVPGGQRQVAGVTWVSVLPTHRRRGILSQMMRHQLHGIHEAQREPVAALWASEAAIYGRFGYGAASRHLSLTVPRGPSTLVPTPVDDRLGLRLVPLDDSMPLVEPVYQAAVEERPGMLTRDERWRRRAISDPSAHRKDKSTLRCVIAEDDDGVRGYARYATAMAWQGSGPEGVVHVREMQALDPAAYAAVWRYLSDLDLTTSVSTRNRPVDDPLLDLLTNVRAANPALSDGLYVRLVDVDRALADRGYTGRVDLVLEVTDELCPWNTGRWRLSADGTGATCERSTAPTDLRLSTTELGAVYLGGGSLTALAGAGRVDEVRRGALAAASRAFTHDRQPCCPFVF